jgi:hypothetical protein
MPALVGVWASFSRWPALAGVQTGFSRFGLFREIGADRLFAAQTGFSRIGNSREKLVFGGRNWAQKSSNPEELGRIRLRERKGR